MHFSDHGARIHIRCTKYLERTRCAPALGQGRAFQQNGPRISPRHIDVRSIRAWVDPKPVRRPTEPRSSVRGIALHRDNVIIDINLIIIDEPFSHLAQRQAMPHRHRPCSDKAFPSQTQRKALYRASGGVWAVKYPNRLSMRSSSLQHVQ